MISQAHRLSRVLGVDGDRNGWVGVVLADGGFESAHLASTLEDLHGRCGRIQAIAIDMPIGWCRGQRESDRLARRELGRRASTIFNAPPAAARSAATYAEANERSRAETGKGLAAQSWALVPKIREATEFAATRDAVFEAHPELTFTELGAGEPPVHPKRTWAGQRERLALLEAAGILLPDELGSAGAAGAEDLIDAAAVAWTAARFSRGEARALPPNLETDVDGRDVAIWV